MKPFLPATGLRLDHFHLGCCYYPEHRTREEIISDISRMAKAGLSIIRVGEGAWWYWQPEEGKFQFDLFDLTLDLCDKHGIKVFLGTPTYACPAWVVEKYPEILRWNFNRIPMKHGSRRNLTYSSPKYTELSDILCKTLAKHYKDAAPVIGWQLDNEFNCHMGVSYAPCDTLAFRSWLREKYGTLDCLNEAWGTKFWSQVYNDWEQIDLPHPTATRLNPSQLLDESRFISDTVVKFAERQAKILRSTNPSWMITHNSIFENVNGPDLVSKLDFFSFDHYPFFTTKWAKSVMGLVRFRGYSFPFGIMEHQAGPGGQMEYIQRSPRPGELHLLTWESIAHGAKFINYFLWRTCPFGSEQHWHGLIDQDNRDTRKLAEASLVAMEAKKLPAEFYDTPPRKQFAVLENFANEVNDYRINTYASEGNGEAYRWIEQLASAHYPVDMVWEESEWKDYAFILAPHVRILTVSLAEKMRDYVSQGGVLILGARTGVYDDRLHVVEEVLPGRAADLSGTEVEEWTTLAKEETHNVLLSNGSLIQLGVFADCLKALSAEIVGTWETDDLLLNKRPAITRRKLGKGEVWYIGGYCHENAMRGLLGFWEETYRLTPLVDAPAEVEIVEKQSAKSQWLVVLNHSSKPQTVKKLPDGRDYLGGKETGSTLQLEPYGVAVIEISNNP